MEAITTAMGTAFATVVSDFTSVVTTALPYAIGIFGTFITVKLGMKFFKQVAGR